MPRLPANWSFCDYHCWSLFHLAAFLEESPVIHESGVTWCLPSSVSHLPYFSLVNPISYPPHVTPVCPVKLGTIRKFSPSLFTYCCWTPHVRLPFLSGMSVGPAFRASRYILHNLKQPGLIHESIQERVQGEISEFSVLCHIPASFHYCFSSVE